MSEIFAKSIVKSLGFIGLVTSIYLGAGCNRNLIKIICIYGTLSFIVIYVWNSYHAFKNKEKEKEKEKDLETITNLKLKIETIVSNLNKLNENNKGLLEERKDYQRIIENKDNKIYKLEKEIRELERRIILNERR